MSGSDAPEWLARLPEPALADLADLRGRGGLAVVVAEGVAWLHIGVEANDPGLRHRLMAVPGAALYERREGLWFPPGRALPALDVAFPESASVSLDRAIVPAPFEPIAPPSDLPSPAPLGLVRDDRARPASALICAVSDLLPWSDRAPTGEIEGLSAALSGERALVRGRPLPPIVGARRFWGRRVLAPLGFRVDPALPESALREAAGAGEEELVLVEEGGCEIVPESALMPLSRASVRLAAGRGEG